MENNRSVPYNTEAEIYVLGSAFLDNQLVSGYIGKLVEDDFYDGDDLLTFCNRCMENGSEIECQDDIMNDLKRNLPISVNWVDEVDKSYRTEFSLTKNHSFPSRKNIGAENPNIFNIVH